MKSILLSLVVLTTVSFVGTASAAEHKGEHHKKQEGEMVKHTGHEGHDHDHDHKHEEKVAK